MKNTLLLLCLVTLPSVCSAQTDALPPLAPYFSALIVENIDTSISWYTNTLGFEVLNNKDYPEMGFKQANLKTGQTAIELIELNRALSLPDVLPDYNKKTRTIGIFKIGFSVADFDRWLLHLEAAGANFYGHVVKDKTSEKKMIIILDPDGNRIQIFEK